MRRVLKWASVVLGVIVALPVVAVIAVLIALNTGPGQRLVERETTGLTGGMVVLTGLSGSFPSALRAARVEIHDAAGPWLVLQDIALDWSPLALLHRDAHVDRLAVGIVSVARLPESSPQPQKPAATSNSGFTLPVTVDIDALSVGRFDLAAPIAGTPATLAIDGQAHLASLEQGTATLAIRQLDGPGRYTISGAVDPAHLTAHIALDEPTRGLLSRLGQVPELGALSAKADLDGPRAGAGLSLAVAAGPLRATAKGTIDLVHDAADLDVTASAPHMQPRAGVSWDAIALDAHVHGPFTRPDAAGSLEVTQLAAAGAAIAKLTAKVSGNAGQVALDANVEGLRIPGPNPELLEAAPVRLTAQIQLDAPTRPVTFSISHPLLAAKGTATTGGTMAGEVALTLPDLAKLAALGGVDLQGSSQLALKAAISGDTTTAEVDGTLHITGGMKPVPGLIGDARLGVTAAISGQDITLSRLTVDGRSLKLQATGGLNKGVAKADLTVALSDLTVLAPTIAGALQAQGHVEGPIGDFSAKVDLAGEVTIQGHRGPLKATLAAAGLPSAPTGQLQAQGTLDDAPLSLDIGVKRHPDGAMTVAIDRADWKTAHAEGNLALAPGATIPTGHVALRMTRLADLRPLIGQDLAGAVTLDAVLPTADLLRLQLDATGAGLPGTAEVGHARLTGEVRDPATHPMVDAALTVEGLRAGAISGNAKLNVRGPQEALSVRLDAGLHGVAGADATVATAATIDAVKREVALASLTADWKGLAARLLGPARIGLAQGVSVDRLRLGLGQAEIDVAGRATPTLDLTVAVRRVTPDLARLFVPDLQADGTLTADAHLTGTPDRPTGTVKLVAAGLHMRTGPARSLPPANLNADAQLQGVSTRLDIRLDAGTTRLAVTGQAPLAAAGAISLRATGGLNLAMLDPILSAQGRRLRGQVSLDATASGTIAALRLAGTAQLTQGELQDFTQGVHLTAMQATLQASGQELRIASFSAHAGAGTISAAGTVGVLAPGMPVDITITARDAKPLASDLITAVLDADLTLRGQVQGHLAAGGKIVIRTANIQVPETLPTSIAVLNVRVPGQKPPPPPSPGPDVALDLTLQAPQGIFVRGRGLDAELGGEMHVGGTAASPRPTGGFQLRRGVFSLAGVTLTFSTGEVTFNGASKIDPTLNFVANSSTSSVVATLTVGGYASAPKITLSSVPELPQDEVLAHLLFNTSASSLSAFQLAEIAGALAQISGVTSGVGDPLATARKALGLDQLNVGSSSTGSPTLDAGRYVAKGVYVGAKQGLGGSAGTQATVQIDIAKGLKLETDAGSGTGANSVGLTYQFEY